MKKLIATVTCALMCTMAFTPAAFADSVSGVTNVEDMQPIPVYRLYTPVNGEHLYTTDENEAITLSSKKDGWTYEGVGWFSANEGKPVYRLNNDVLRNHLYTTDENEVKELTTKDIWKLDNEGEPLFYSAGNVGVCRVYNKALNGMHHLTTDLNEYNVLPNHGWKQEGKQALFALCDGLQAEDFEIGTSLLLEPDAKEVGHNIGNTDSWASIEADVKLSGKGTGYHAKLVAVTPTTGVSFGIQYDKGAARPFTDMTAFIFENVMNNNAAGQNYPRSGYALRDKSYHMMLTVNKSGLCKGYVDGKLVGQVYNYALSTLIEKGERIDLRVEASGRLNGDEVDCEFKNIKVKTLGAYDATKTYSTGHFQTNKGIQINDKYALDGTVQFKGKIEGLQGNQDWDSAYEGVSGIVQFNEPA